MASPVSATQSVKSKNSLKQKNAKEIEKNETQEFLRIKRWFTKSDIHPFDEIEWEKRTSAISGDKGNTIFELKDVEVPKSWSQLATDILISKYFRRAGVPKTDREVSTRQVVYRLARTLRVAGEKQGKYFKNKNEAEIFEAELTYILINQIAAFNSPVWFNVGLYHQYGIRGGSGNWHWDARKKQVIQVENDYEFPQCSACFIQSVEDDLMAIFELLKSEARLFKYGSGSGTNFSPLRGRQEKLSGGGTSSGMMSFLDVLDRGAGATKSGGTTRRASKMVIVNLDHPEIVDFINWKVKEERKVAALVAAGYSSDFNSEAYKTVGGQNSNNSVRATDEFMEAVVSDKEWHTRLRTTGEINETFKAKELFKMICEAAWHCADPGIQFDTAINYWHTCPNSGRINASNPCSEYMFLDDSSCNLSSINLVKFLRADGSFDLDGFLHTIEVMFIAQEIIVNFASYPTQNIAENSHRFRPLGLGYANLGTLLMMLGIPYDSPQALAYAGAITAIMTGRAYLTSAYLAHHLGPFEEYPKNRSAMLKVMEQHRASIKRVDENLCPQPLYQAAKHEWSNVVNLGQKFGFRNAQTTLLAPTGTIGLLMDCDTTGIEPDYALVKLKKLAGGGYFKIVNRSVPMALKRLGYSLDEIKEIITYATGTTTLIGAPHVNPEALEEKGLSKIDIAAVEKYLKGVLHLKDAFNPYVLSESTLVNLGIKKETYQDPGFNLLITIGVTDQQIQEAEDVICGTMTLEGAPHLKIEHLPIFDCANRCGQYGKRFIEPMGHVRMMAAVQPFLSGSISKTVNMSHESTLEDINNIYMESWKLGVKSIAIYRDGSKLSQPLNVATKEKEAMKSKPMRRKLPDERRAITHKFSISGHEGYVTVGMYEEGQPGEIFIVMNKEGSVISGMMDAFATSVSIALQYGVPLKTLVNKFAHVRFEPSGITNNPQIRIAKSIIDYIFRWLAIKFLAREDQIMIGINNHAEKEGTLSDSFNKSKPGNQTVVASPASPSEIELQATQRTFSFNLEADAPVCPDCGSIMIRSGTCFRCDNCGSTTGCS